MQKFRILHAPHNVANMAWTFATEQRKRGYVAHVAIKTVARRKFGYDINVKCGEQDKQSLWKIIRRSYYFCKFVLYYDVYFFSYCDSLSLFFPIFPNHFDLPLLKLMGKKIVMFTNGGDIIPANALKCARFRENGCGDCYECSDRQEKKEKIERVKKYCDTVFSSCRTLEFAKTGTNDEKISEIIINPVDLEKLPFVGVKEKSSDETITVVHAPSRLQIKDTKEIQEVIGRLAEEGYPVQLVIVNDVPHDEAITRYKEADIIVDHLSNGWYGSLSLEAMALGKPLLTNLRLDLARRYSDRIDASPIINVNQETLYDRIKPLLEDCALRTQLAYEGRKFVEKFHSVEVIVDNIHELIKV